MRDEKHFDVEQFAAHVARLQHEHASRSEEWGAMRSAAAIRSWGEKVPPGLSMTARDLIVAEHRNTWMRDAESVVRTLDHRAFEHGSFHVIDGREIGMPPRGFMGLAVGCQLHDLARDYLPRTARTPVAAVAVMVDVIAGVTCGMICPARDHAIGKIRAAVAAIAAHEYAHNVVAAVRGERLAADTTIESVVAGLRSGGPDKQRSVAQHGPAWCRAYAHLVKRAAFVPHHAVWIERFRGDVAAVHADGPHPEAMLDALHTDFVRFTSDDALADVIRTPAPTGFLKLFDDTLAAMPAGTQE